MVFNLNAFFIDVYGFHGEIDPYCVAVALYEIARFEALDDTRLSCSAITNKDYLKQEVECVVCRNGHQCGGISGGH